MYRTLSLMAQIFTLLLVASALKAQSLVGIAMKRERIVATVYSEKLQKQRAVTLDPQVKRLPSYALLSPDRSKMALIYRGNSKEKKAAEILFLHFPTGRLQTRLRFPLATTLWGCRWVDNRSFSYDIRYVVAKTHKADPQDSNPQSKREEAHYHDRVLHDILTGETTVTERLYGLKGVSFLKLPYTLRAAKAAERFDKIRVAPPVLPFDNIGSDYVTPLGFDGGTGYGAVSVDGKFVVLVTSAGKGYSIEKHQVNELFAVVTAERLLGKVSLPIDVKSGNFNIIGKQITLTATRNNQEIVLVWRLPDLKFMGKINAYLIANEGEQ